MIKKLIFTIFILFSLKIESNETELLLYSQFGEYCTMCEAVLLCDKGEIKNHTSIPDEGEFTLYHLKTRTFLSQITTIWEFFIKNFEGYEVKGHQRPVIIISAKDRDWSAPALGKARISVEPDLIFLNHRKINRLNNQWMDNDNKILGICHRLPLWDSIETIDNRSN